MRVNLFDHETTDAVLARTSETMNPEQQEAVEHVEGPILVLAGAGSGKTRVLTVRIARLIAEHGVPADRILAVTFTNKAAGEIRARIRRFLGRDPVGMWMGTFHSLGARLLRRHAELLGWDSTFTIFDAEESLREIKRIMDREQLDPKRWKPQAVRSAMSDAKNQLVGPDAFVAQHADGFDFFLKTVAKIYPAYQASLREQNAFDFDDLLVKPVELFRDHEQVLERYRERFAFILVDEYQDTNRAQFLFLEMLAAKHRNIMVVGDDDQSIYGWRGADVRNILDFEKTYPGARVIRLERNYRSTGNILAAANEVIRRNLQRKEKTLRTDRDAGESLVLVECADERDEARWMVEEIETRRSQDASIPYQDFAILYRTNAQSRALEDAFRRRGVPYQIVGGVRFYERREIQDVLAYLRLISNPRDAAAFQRIVNVPKRGIGATSQKRFQGWAVEAGVSPLEATERLDEVPDLPRAARNSLQGFGELIRRFSIRATQVSVGTLLEELLEELDFLAQLRAEGPEGEDRAENVKELVAGALDFDAELEEEWGDETPPDTFTELDLFLQQVALVTDLDRADEDADTVTFMTLHNAKGLEFPTVFLAGLENGLFPMGRAFDDPAQLEEERRLFYVGVTRAEDRLFLSWARERRRAGDFMMCTLSSFVSDIPEELLVTRRTPHLEAQTRTFDARDRSGGRTGESGGFGSSLGAARAAKGDPSEGRASARRAAERERTFEEGLNQDAPHLVPGERVSHATFGSGTVKGVSGFGRDLKVTVDFDGVGEKKLLARYAKLERDF
ncbi:MAG: ATP-dependent DNA helicase PcrA [Gemmatimonadales bacterium]|nr:MAG: ATP-dependent DNA helicase PcrA [Gemmatimonadales bacterium]